MTNWEDIRGEIYQEEAPLSKAELALMERKLSRGAMGWYTYGLLFLALMLTAGGWWWLRPLEKEPTNQEQRQPPSTQSVVPASAEKKPAKKNFFMTNKTEASAQTLARPDYDTKGRDPSQSERNGAKEASTERKLSRATSVDASSKSFASFSLLTADNQALKLNAGEVSGEKSQRSLSGNNNRRFSVKFFAGYSLAINQPGLNLDAEAQHYRFENLAQENQLGGGMHLGAEIHYRLYKNLSLGLGFDFFELQRQYNFNHRINDIPVVDSASGHIIGYLTRAEAEQISASGQSRFGYLGIPFSLDYTYNFSTRWSLRAEARYTHYLNIYVQGLELDPQSLTPRDVSRESAQDLGSVKLSAALHYRISPNNTVALETSYTRFTGALYQNAVYNWQPEMLGLQLQMIYEF
jgi:hypothetical protein